MKKRKTEAAAPEKRVLPPPSPVVGKVIKQRSGKMVRQYPAQIGYHGTGDEADLNPEE